MKAWISKYWRWLIGAPVVVAVLTTLAKLFRPKPQPYVPVPTKKEADEKHEAIDETKNETLDAIDKEIDDDLEKIHNKFGRN